MNDSDETMTREMTQADALIWYEALKSNKYKQGKGKLIDETEDGTLAYCCLGVAVDVLDAPRGDLGRCNFWLDDRYLASHIQQEMINMNDADKSFFEIADHLRNCLMQELPEGDNAGPESPERWYDEQRERLRRQRKQLNESEN